MEIRNKNADPEGKKYLPAVVHPKVVVSPHPISASLNRQLFYADFIPGECLLDYLDRLTLLPPPAIRDNFVLSFNGRMVTFAESKLIFPKTGDMIVIRARVHGGGDGGSNPLTVVLMIAVIIASQGMGAAWVGMMTGTSMAVGSAVVLIGGMLLIAALVPIKVPSLDTSTPDPTYSLQGSQNRARPYEPLPVIFGVVRVFPDHGAKPFTTYENNDQQLIQVFNLGLTDPAVSDWKIGDADIDDFFGAYQDESLNDTGKLNIYPANVDTLAGADLIANAGVFVIRTSSPNTTRLSVDISGLNFFIGREEGLTEARITLTAEYRVDGSGGAWLPYFRTYAGLGQFTDFNELDLVNGDKEFFRTSYQRFVTEETYEVRVMLWDRADVVYRGQDCDEEGENCTPTVRYSARGLNNDGMTQVLNWDTLKSYQPDTADYTGQKRIGLEVRANAQLNGILDSLSVLCSVTIPVWNGSSWVNAVSSNPAWQFLQLARGKFNAAGKRLYGAGLDDSRIDIEGIKLWGIWCDNKSLACNIVMTEKLSVIDMMNTVARVGRGSATWSNGLLGVVYDEAAKPPVAMFGMSNIVHNSFSVNYVSNTQVDEIIVAFINPDLNWQRDTVRVLVPDPAVVSPVNSVTIEIPGITDEAQAAKEANLIAAEQYYRRRVISWETDIEGLTVQRGDVSVLSHDITQWDFSGRLVSGPTTTQLELDREVPFTYGETHYVGLKHPDGTYTINEVSFTGTPNLFSYPEELDNGYWTKSGNVSVDANNTNAPDGTLTAELFTSSWVGPSAQTIVGEQASGLSSEEYQTISTYIKVKVGGWVCQTLWNGSEVTRQFFNLETGEVGTPKYSGTAATTLPVVSTAIESAGSGWYRISTTVHNVNLLALKVRVIQMASSQNGEFADTNGDAYWVWGAMLTVGIPGNLITYSEQFDNAVWTKNRVTVDDNAATAPDGTFTADKIVCVGTTDPQVRQAYSPPSIAENDTYTFSVWLWTDSGQNTYAQLFIYGNDYTTDGMIENNTVVLSTVPQRFSVTITAPSGVTSSSITARFDLVNIPSGGEYIYAWGAMVTSGPLVDYISPLVDYINDTSTILLQTPLSAAPNDDVLNEPMDYMWFFGPSATPGKLVKITDITPLSEDRVRVVATDEDPDYYLSESNSYTYVTPETFLVGVPIITNLELGESLVIVGSGFSSHVNVTWEITRDYGGAFIRVKDEDSEWRDMGRTLDKSFTFTWRESKTVVVEVTAFSLDYKWSNVSRATASLLLVGKMKLPADVTNFTVLQNGAVVVMKWTQVPDVDLAGYDIRYGNPGLSTYDNATPLTSVTRGTNVTSADLPPGTWTIYIKAVDTSGNYSANATTRNITLLTASDYILEVEQSPFNLVFASKIIDNTAEWGQLYQLVPMVDSTRTHYAQCWIKKDAVAKTTRFGLIRMSFYGAVPQSCELNFDSSTGEISKNTGTHDIYVTEWEEYWSFSIWAVPDDSNNTHVQLELFPAVGSGSLSATNHDATTTGDMTFLNLGVSEYISPEVSNPITDYSYDYNSSVWNLALGATVTDNVAEPPMEKRGTAENFIAHHTGKLVPQSQEANSNDGATDWADDTVFEIFVNNPYKLCTYVAPQFDISFDDDVRVWGPIDSELGQGITTGVADPTLELDHRTSAGSYDGYESWSVGNVNGRYFKHKLTLDTDVGVAVITGFLPTVDFVERITNQDVTVAAGGTTIAFDRQFHFVPFGSVTAVTIPGGQGTKGYATLTTVTTTQALVNIYNTNGTSVGGTGFMTLTGV